MKLLHYTYITFFTNSVVYLKTTGRYGKQNFSNKVLFSSAAFFYLWEFVRDTQFCLSRKTISRVLFDDDFRIGRKGRNDITGMGEREESKDEISKSDDRSTMRTVTNAPVFDLQVQKTWPSFRAARGTGRPRFHPPRVPFFFPSTRHSHPQLEKPPAFSVSFTPSRSRYRSYTIHPLPTNLRATVSWGNFSPSDISYHASIPPRSLSSVDPVRIE